MMKVIVVYCVDVWCVMMGCVGGVGLVVLCDGFRSGI